MILGHKKQWEILRRTAETGKISHAYLFAGQEQLGKRRVATEWLSLLFGQDITEGQHPDLIFIEAESEKKEIQIDQIRNLIWKLSLKPYLAPFKAAIIDEAHLMNQEAQSCLLKTLEEPKGQAILILITPFPEYLFSTIISRVSTIQFYPVESGEIKEYLEKEGVAEAEAERVAGLSLGRPGKALDFVSDSGKLNDFYQKREKLEKISKSTISSRFQYAKVLSEDSKNLRETLDIWLAYFREILFDKLRGKPAAYTLKGLSKILKLIQTTKFLITTTNVNPRLALERLMLEF